MYMKTNKCISIVVMLVSISTFASFGQIRLNVNVNLQPSWGPASCNYAEYYYLPELGVYYSINDQLFIYPSENRWVRAVRLPRAYRHCNLYNTYKVVINAPAPYHRHSYYANRYNNWKGKHQETMRDVRQSDHRKHLGHNKNQNRLHEERMFVYDNENENKHHHRR